MSSRPSRSTIPQRGHLYWGQVPYLPERPLDVLRRKPSRGEIRAALTFKTRPILVVQNPQATPTLPIALC